MARVEGRPPGQGGFTLVEAVLAIAVMSILAGAMAPLAVRTLDRRREQVTRELLRQAFEALYGSRDRNLPNMRSDFGFRADGSLPDLRVMLNRPALTEPYGLVERHGNLGFGWNGPYWFGPVAGEGAAQAPADAWGERIRLVRGGEGNVQLVAHGGLCYPPMPVNQDGFRATVNLHFTALTPGTWALGHQQMVFGPAHGTGSAPPLERMQGSRAVLLEDSDRTPTPLDAGRTRNRTFQVYGGCLLVFDRHLPEEDGKRSSSSSSSSSTTSSLTSSMSPSSSSSTRGRSYYAHDHWLPLNLLPGETRDVWVAL
jgi:prepilin-type N-terminal cleavage/methylation domain-containing protein